jgi:hypothetical protein
MAPNARIRVKRQTELPRWRLQSNERNFILGMQRASTNDDTFQRRDLTDLSVGAIN